MAMDVAFVAIRGIVFAKCVLSVVFACKQSVAKCRRRHFKHVGIYSLEAKPNARTS